MVEPWYLEVKANVFVAEDLAEVVTQGHVLAADMTIQKITLLEDLFLTEGEHMTSLCQRIVDTFLTPIFFGVEELPGDHVALYTRDLMLMGLLWYSFKDVISEADGPAVMSYWKVMTLIFRLTNYRKSECKAYL